jgi:DNA ligase D-like protein (predicted 3'-phosphoesterase)
MVLFVIHEHHATHLHWDIRLEKDGTLKSWACPKEPSNDPSVKRLVIQVDDHDLDYADFVGEITEGYGKGTVKRWDKGTYTLVNEKPNKWIVDLKGKKLQGEYVLLKFDKAGPKAWLFFKKKEG